jgi:hypothetical protein
MIKKWLYWINLSLAGLALFFILWGLLLLILRPSEIVTSDNPPPKTALPKRAFALQQEAYDLIGEPMLSLQFAPVSLQLPDIKRYIVYYGKNGRPDAQAENPRMHFSFTGNKTISSVNPGERLYLLFNRELNPPQYVFSPENTPTSLWIEATPKGNEAIVSVAMKSENGDIIREPASLASFTTPEKEYIRFGGVPWEIGKNRVDATLLAKQKARWYGADMFLQKHGGQEYAQEASKQRIDFGEGDDLYSVFVSLGDSLVWNGERWTMVKPGPDSLGKPLLLVKKIDERLMNFELWDPDGKGKIAVNLMKSTDANQPVNIVQQFKFVGARTRTQFVFEINKERMLLSPHDWLLLTKEGWMKLETPQEIDDYVERRRTGPLFVFDEVDRKDDKGVINGTLFSASRTTTVPVEIPLQQGGVVTTDKKDERIEKIKARLRARGTNDFEDNEDMDDELEEQQGPPYR